MFPILQRGDILRLDSCNEKPPQVGDVVVFQRPKRGGLIVHRIVFVGQKRIRTKGDNNESVDNWVLSVCDILGRIVSVNRGGKKIIILGGFCGQKYALALRNLKRIYSALLSAVLSPAYNWFSDKGIFHNLFTNQENIRLYCFKRGNTLELQLLLGRRVIGRLLPGKRQWYIKRPFRLFIDERCFPDNNFIDYVSTRHSFS